MAAKWAKSPPEGVGTRKKWNLEDRTSLNNLKYHIASEGCSDVQYGLAKDLLDLDGDISSSNQRQAVHWLICAAQQGHEQAITLLEECYKRNRGITPENESEVKCCLSMTQGERAARKAARELFSCLSNGNEHITPKQLERKMRKIYNLQKRRRRHRGSTSTSEDDSSDENAIEDKATNNISIDEKLRTGRKFSSENNCLITEENLVSAAVNYTAGRLPPVNDALVYSVPHPSSLDHISRFSRIFYHPIIFITILYHKLINFISAIPTRITPNVRMLLLVLIYWLTSNENRSTIIPIVFYYLCLTVMIWSTCKMLKTKQDFIDFRIWSGLFLRYGDHNIEADISEHRFLKNNMKPYLYFFCAFISSFIIYPFVTDKEWLFYSEITILSCMFVFITLFVFMYSSRHDFPDWVTLLSFGVNVLAKYPYEMDKVVTIRWRFLDLKIPSFSSFVIGNGIEFCLNSRTAFYLLIPGFLIHLARRSKWRGTYTYLIQHCVTLSWLQLCITTAQSGATMLGVVRGTLCLAGVLLFLPLFGIISLLIPIFVAVDWMGLTDPNVRWLSTLIVGTITLTGSCFLALNRTTQKYVTIVQVILGIIAATVLIYPYMTSMNTYKDESGKPLYKTIPPDSHSVNQNILSWPTFYENCGESAWEGHNNKIKTQLRCSHLEGTEVTWDGIVSEVQISSVSNVRAEFIKNYFPSWLAHITECIYGERINNFEECDSENRGSCFEDVQDIFKNIPLNRKCHLNKWNQYEYEIYVKMSAGLLSKGTTVILHAGHMFGNFTNRLTVGDRIVFRGKLQNSRILSNGFRQDYILGSAYPNMRLLAAKCILCRSKNIPIISLESESAVNARLQDIKRGIKYLLNVLLNPLITFK